MKTKHIAPPTRKIGQLLTTVFLCSTLLGCQPDEPAVMLEPSGLGMVDGAFSHDGEYALLATVDAGTQYWHLATETVNHTFRSLDEASAPMEHVAISHHGELAVTTAIGQLFLWDGKTGQSINQFQIPAPISALDLSSGGRFALVGGLDGKARLIDLQHGVQLRDFIHEDSIESVALSANDEFAAIAASDRRVHVWSLNSGELVFHKQYSRRPARVFISPDGQWLLVTVPNYGTELIDLKTATEKHLLSTSPYKINWSNHTLNVTAVTFLSDGQHFLTATPPRMVQLWSLDKPNRLKQWTLPYRSAFKATAAIGKDLVVNDSEKRFYVSASNGVVYGYPLDLEQLTGE